jgi:hypothetical protein
MPRVPLHRPMCHLDFFRGWGENSIRWRNLAGVNANLARKAKSAGNFGLGCKAIHIREVRKRAIEARQCRFSHRHGWRPSLRPCIADGGSQALESCSLACLSNMHSSLSLQLLSARAGYGIVFHADGVPAHLNELSPMQFAASSLVCLPTQSLIASPAFLDRVLAPQPLGYPLALTMFESSVIVAVVLILTRTGTPWSRLSHDQEPPNDAS